MNSNVSDTYPMSPHVTICIGEKQLYEKNIFERKTNFQHQLTFFGIFWFSEHTPFKSLSFKRLNVRHLTVYRIGLLIDISENCGTVSHVLYHLVYGARIAEMPQRRWMMFISVLKGCLHYDTCTPYMYVVQVYGVHVS